MANPSLQPYTVNSYEGGIELGFFDNRIYTDFTYFMMYNGPQIFEKTAAPSTGFTSEMINGIITKKSGYEISLNLVPIAQQNGLRWQIGLNYANYKEVLQEGIDGEGVTIRDQYFEVGDRMDAIYGRMYNRTADGAIIHDETGLPVFSPSGVDNLKKLGYANPDYVWGITNQINYKNWNMSFQFDGRVGGIMYSELYARQFQSGTSPTLVDGAMGEARLAEWEHYKETGELEGKYISPGVRIVSGTPEFENGYIVNLDELELEENGEPVRLQAFSAQVMGNVDEHFVVSKTYAKLREVTLGYTFPQSAFSGGRIQGLSISLVGKNLLYFAKHTNIIKGMDMDEYGEGYDVAKSSLTFRAPHHRTQSPTTRQIGLNLRITF